MCVRVSNREVENINLYEPNYCIASVTGALTAQILSFAQTEGLNREEYFARRVAAGVAYALLAVASLVEIAVRIIFPLVALLPACLIFGKGSDEVEVLAGVAVLGAQNGPDTTIRCLTAFVQNFYKERMDFEGLALCEFECCV